MSIDEYRASDLQEYISVTTALRDRWGKHPWFRGQTCSKDRLVPRFYRYDLNGVSWVREWDLRIEFRRIGSQLISENQPTNYWQWYFLMQHYGCPTRLLDWTEGALIALYFAVAAGYRKRLLLRTDLTLPADAAVWAIDPIWLNALKDGLNRDALAFPEEDAQLEKWLPRDGSGGKVPEAMLPAAVAPTHIARRIAVQRGHFTIFGTQPDGISLAAEGDSRARLAKILIPADRVDLVYRDLFLSGLTEASLFPDLDGLARELEEKWLTKTFNVK